MNVFELRDQLVKDYGAFARSFTKIKSADIHEQLKAIYEDDRFWPEPLLQINPNYKPGPTIAELSHNRELHPLCAEIFQIRDESTGDRTPLSLHTHQFQALSAGKSGASYVVTTGTGSGKSLCFFIPIIDAILREKEVDATPRTRAVIVYPMNALANSQMEELEKFIQNVTPRPVTFARYTGQEDAGLREGIAGNPPDILLTNFVMLEYLMTRQDPIDRRVIGNCAGLRFLVLDELHTYRGRQGADVALLVRRIKASLAGPQLQCIGTSATMASGNELDRKQAVAEVASKLFGTAITTNNVIGETLRRVTNPDKTAESVKADLAAVLSAPMPVTVTDAELCEHPLAIWVETRLGLEWESDKWVRAKPQMLSTAVRWLSEDSRVSHPQCAERLQEFLMLTSLAEGDRVSGQHTHARGFFAFRLHQFISGAGTAYGTIDSPGKRTVTTNGQQYLPGQDTKRLYPIHFCRDCGQEYYPVLLGDRDGIKQVLPREIEDIPVAKDEEGEEVGATDAKQKYGFLVLTPSDGTLDFADRTEDYPESWLEFDAQGVPRLRATPARQYRAKPIRVEPTGEVGTGADGWFLPGKFRFCVNCKTVHSAQGRDGNRLASLSSEGRSSATSIFTHSILRWMDGQSEQSMPVTRRKLLGFTDNRQDAALQAGHFNDFLFVGILRGGILGAVAKAGDAGLTSDRIGQAVVRALGFERAELRDEWLLNPELSGVQFLNAQRALREMLAYRVWVDQRRGWRFTNPNLEQLGLMSVDYEGLAEFAAADANFKDSHEMLVEADLDTRLAVFQELLDAMRQGLAVTADVLAAPEAEALKARSRDLLRAPWGFGREERPRISRYLMPQAPNRRENSLGDEDLVIRAGPQSALGRTLRSPSLWGGDLRAAALKREDYDRLLTGMLRAAAKAGLVIEVPSPFSGFAGWQLNAGCVLFRHGKGAARRGRMDNAYFRSLYANLAEALATGYHVFHYEAREHTAQVDADRREIREMRFRFGDSEQAELESRNAQLAEIGENKRFLPVLFCSPTMELGVDISALNTVYLRNVPPTPANYAQRSGRAGRSGMPALILTYCAARSPHDQFFFADPPAMVHGEVRAPTLDLANEDLVRSHLQAVWLAATESRLSPSISEVIDPDETKGLPLRPEITDGLTRPSINPEARARVMKVLDLVEPELTPEAAPWFKGKQPLADDVVDNAFRRFDDAFRRWRELFMSAARQRDLARRTMDTHNLPERERNAARMLHGQAMDQLTLLQRGQESLSSDFYTYRYLATEGFMPGYNFPRLPLTAFIPGSIDRQGGRGGAYLQRPRFLALSEFGPRSLVYHEGRAYRVIAAQLGVRHGESPDGQLPTDTVMICRSCGAAHFQADPADHDASHCRSCRVPLTDNVEIVRNLYRIENVRTMPTERITVNDEERVRQGFELQTTFRWARRENGQPDVRSIKAVDDEGDIVMLHYGPSAEISRLNKGLRRRANPTQHGFRINPMNGAWAKLEDEDTDANDDPTRIANQWVVPWVRDRKNALLLLIPDPEITETAAATVQYALKRGIEAVYQLEESELLAEPLPDRKRRTGVLFYEATEGGAGVLSRLIGEPDAMSRVAHAALRLLHLDIPEPGEPLPPVDALKDAGDPNCVAGCYRCVLSYYNQPDHTVIDRRDRLARSILLRLAGARTRSFDATVPTTSVATDVPQTFDPGTYGLPPADLLNGEIAGVPVIAAWRAARVALVNGDVDAAALRERGMTVIEWADGAVATLKAHLQ
jgi:superfamily II DNA/RNA helicase